MALDPSRYAYIIPATSQFLDENGRPLIGGHCVVYIHGTTGDPYQTYQNFEGTANPLNIPIDILGYAPAIGLNTQTYDLYVYTANGSLFYSRLNIGTQSPGGSSFELNTDNTLKGESTPSDPLGVNVPEVIGGLVRGIHADSDNVHPRTYQYLPDGSIIVGLSVDEPTFTGGTGVSVNQETHEIDIDPTVWQEKLVAGENVQINPTTHVISATDTKYTGGFGITVDGTTISLDPTAQLDVDYWTGYGSGGIVSNDLNSELNLSRSHGEKIYLNDNSEVMLTTGAYVIHAFVKMNNVNCTVDDQVYKFDIFGGVLGGDPRVIVEFDNSFIHTKEYELSFFTANNSTNDVKLGLGTDAALLLNGLRVSLEYVQVYCLNGLGGGSSSGGDTGKTYILTSNDNSITITETVVGDTVTYDLSVYNANQEQADWAQNDSTAVDYIKNKPDLSIYATKSELQEVESEIPAPQVQSDWSQSNSSAVDYIKNKPTLFSGDYNDLTNKPDLSVYALASDLPTIGYIDI